MNATASKKYIVGVLRMNFKLTPARKIIGLLLLGILSLGSAFALGSAFFDRGQMHSSGGHSMHDMNHGSGAQNIEGSTHDMSFVDTSSAVTADPKARGNQILKPEIVNGVKEFELSARIVKWSILPNVTVGAYTYNGQVPGPLIKVNAGDRIRIKVKNELPEPTSIHWHGLILPNDQDGAADITQPPIQPGETYTYEYSVPDTPGSYFYHAHYRSDRQQALGLYGAMLIEAPNAPKNPEYDAEYILELGEWRVKNGQTFPAMEMEGSLPNFFTINGKSYPATEMINAKVGDRILLRFIGSGQFVHPMHVHGGPFEIVATDGNPVKPSARQIKDTVLVGPGERYDVIWTAKQPGKWPIHCHINHHMMNDGVEEGGAGGLAMLVNVASPK